MFGRAWRSCIGPFKQVYFYVSAFIYFFLLLAHCVAISLFSHSLSLSLVCGPSLYDRTHNGFLSFTDQESCGNNLSGFHPCAFDPVCVSSLSMLFWILPLLEGCIPAQPPCAFVRPIRGCFLYHYAAHRNGTFPK